ncbi:phenylalanine--tRNA ligase subunit beta [Rathayibacter sp. YIM 133350]|uniref:phenylalanine--tRNA ligase subunit beta n=1 Tax=Rathayibacter sp. YIM 133350 TaxID=3131992 RepID=UPI00307E28D8
MRIPLSWLGEYVDLVPGTTPEEVHAQLVKVGLEEEDVHRFELTGPIVVGEVLEFTAEPQSNGKTIRWCQVRVAPDGASAADGGEAVRGIVCGAGNFFPGDKVVVTLPGAVLPGPFPIAARKTYGHVSDGMIASARELGLGEEHDGILRLTELGLDPEVGTDAIGLLHLDDAAIEINVTPDRGYAFSIRGVAREYAHATGGAFRDPVAQVQATGVAEQGYPVAIDDRAPLRGKVGSTAFSTQIVRGVDPSRRTPAWMVTRLKLAGIRSVSVLVDITNYVMLELGQPLHGYDLDQLRGGIVVRRAAPGEKFTTLDGKERSLSGEDLVVTDDRGPIGLAGVMGGAETEMGPSTTNVLLEAALWDPVSVARTARRHKLPSEAAKRYERGVDPTIGPAAVARAAQLMVDLAGGTADAGGSQVRTTPDRAAILLPDGFVSGLVGVAYTDEEIHSTLVEIGAHVEPAEGGLSVTPPSWRPDITGKADLAEEIARITGYDRIPAVLPVAPPGRGLTRSQRLRRVAADVLAGSGLTEVVAYPFVGVADAAAYGSLEGVVEAPVRVANPLDGEKPLLRTSLLPGLAEVAHRNLSRGLTDLAIFENGLVFLPSASGSLGSPELPIGDERPSDEVLAALAAGIPHQPRNLAGLLIGNAVAKQPGQAAIAWDWEDAVAAVLRLARSLDVDLSIEQGEHVAFHPGRTARIVAVGETVGYAGELLPALAESADLPRVVGAFEVDLDALIRLARTEVLAQPVRTMPAATQDLSLVVAADVPAASVRSAVVDGAGDLLEEARLVDDYRGNGIPEGTKSLTFALRFRAPDRTLTAAEASEAKLAGAARAADLTGAHIRE